MNAYELAEKLNDAVNKNEKHVTLDIQAMLMLRQQADRIAELESCLDFALQDTMDYITLNNLDGENNHWLVWARKLLVNKTPQTKLTPDGLIDPKSYYIGYADGKKAPQTKPLSDEVLNKAFDYYCETDEGVLRFNYELRDEWKKEQLIRWKEAFKKASEK